MSVTLKAKQRKDLRKSVTKQLREDGYIPAVVYGKDIDVESIAVKELDLIKTIQAEGQNVIMSLEIENGESVDVMLQEYQMHPLRNEVLHVDFYAIDLTAEIIANVPIRLEGDASGAREGGILQQPLYELQIEAKPNELPDEITIDISELEIGDSITVADLPEKETYAYVDDLETTIVVILPPEEVEEVEEVEVDVSVEPELVGAEEDDDEEAAEDAEEQDQ